MPLWIERVNNGRSVAAADLLVDAGFRIRNKHSLLVPLVSNDVQIAFACFMQRKNIVLKARQMGISTWVVGWYLLRALLRDGTNSVIAAQTQEAAEGLLRVATNLWQDMDEVDRVMFPPMTGQRCNVLSWGNGSTMRALSASDANAGRGLTIHQLHCSEVARWPGDAGVVLAGLKAALVPDGEMVLESTPQGAHGCFYDEWMGAGANGVQGHFFPWWMEQSYVATAAEDLSGEEEALCAQHGLTREQIGFRRELERTYRRLRKQEFAEDAEECFLASGLCVFELEAIERRLRALKVTTTERWNGTLQVWLPPVAGRRYVMGVDPAGGGSEGDWCGVQIVDRESGLQCAELQAKLHPRELAERVAALAKEYGDALVVVERNNHGAAVIAYLEQSGVLLYTGRDGQAGALTNTASRPEMIAKLGMLLSERPALFLSRRLLLECRSFVTTKSGRAEASAGAHDDLVMAMAIAQSCR